MSDFEDLLALQELDTTIDQLRHRLESLPERGEQARIERELEVLAVTTAAVEERREVVRREQKRHEDEVATIEAKVDHVRHQLYDSGITSAKEAADLQADLDSLVRRQRDLEDLVIEQMELAEPIDEELGALAVQRAGIDAALADATAALRAAAGAVGDELEAAEGRRPAIADAVPADVMKNYAVMRSRLGGIAVARLVGSRCDGCHLTIPSAELEAIKKAPATSTVYCPECTRILVR